MKLIFAIVNKDDSHMVASALIRAGFPNTKLATTGGFLKAGNTTFLLGVADEQVDAVLDVIKKYSKKRTQMVSSAIYGSTEYTTYPVEITVGGATVFVTDVDHYEKF